MYAVFKREVQSYFYTPIGYCFMGFFLLASGYYFGQNNIIELSPSLSTMFYNIMFIFLILVPVLTMRMYSEERKQKTDQMLLTSPLPLFSIVLGKYLAAVFVYFISLLITGIYPVIMLVYGNPALGEIFAGYFGLFLLGMSYIAIGSFISSLTENQVAAAAATFAILLILYVWDSIMPAVNSAFLATVLDWLSITSRFQQFEMGVIGLAPVVYYLSFCGVFLFLTYRSIEKRRWSEG